MRRYETKYYTKDMFRLARHATSFAAITNLYRVSAPTVIVYDPRDNVAGKDDAAWYASRCPRSTMLVVEGGHLGVVATPEKIAQALGNTSEKRIY
jgi:pimeloyl-ACP methyl ester carboxylesterase